MFDGISGRLVKLFGLPLLATLRTAEAFVACKLTPSLTCCTTAVMSTRNGYRCVNASTLCPDLLGWADGAELHFGFDLPIASARRAPPPLLIFFWFGDL